jgi:hypothetical protein
VPPDEGLAAYIEYERQRLAWIGERFPSLSASKVEVVPEYERTLASVLFAHGSLDAAHSFERIASKLPAYAKIVVIGPRNVSADGWEDGLRSRYGREVRVIEADDAAVVDVWGQDVLEKITVSGNDGFLLPLFYRYLREDLLRSSDRQIRSNVDGIAGALDRERLGGAYLAPFFFHGGDVVFDVIGGHRVLLTSADPIAHTQWYYRQVLREQKEATEIVAMMKQAFGVDRVEVLTPEVSGRYSLHVDQNLCLLGRQTALVTRIVTGSGATAPTWAPADMAREVRRSDQIRARLAQLGYTIVDLELTRAQLAAARNGVNGIPYRDARDGQRVFLMPTWEDMSSQERPLQQRNIRRIEEHGLRVALVEDLFYDAGGNTHCVVNVLA